MENGPELWNLIYDKFISAIIAGGCLRDYILDLKEKDVDVFLPDNDYDFQRVWPELIPANEIQGNPLYQGEGDQQFKVDYFSLPNGTLINFIRRPDIRDGSRASCEALIKTFDLGFCRFYWDGDEEIRGTKQAHLDLEESSCTLMTGTSPAKSVQRYTRWKYRDDNWHLSKNFTFNNPKMFA